MRKKILQYPKNFHILWLKSVGAFIWNLIKINAPFLFFVMWAWKFFGYWIIVFTILVRFEIKVCLLKSFFRVTILFRLIILKYFFFFSWFFTKCLYSFPIGWLCNMVRSEMAGINHRSPYCSKRYTNCRRCSFICSERSGSSLGFQSWGKTIRWSSCTSKKCLITYRDDDWLIQSSKWL